MTVGSTIVSDRIADYIYVHSGLTSTIIGSYSVYSGYTDPMGLSLDGVLGSNLIQVGEDDDSVVVYKGLNGTGSRAFSVNNSPYACVVYNGDLYTGHGFGTYHIFKYSGISDTIVGSVYPTSTLSIKGIAFDSNGNLLVNLTDNYLHKYSGFSAVQTGSFSMPSSEDICVDNNDNLYCASDSTNSVYIFSGLSSTITGSFSTVSRVYGITLSIIGQNNFIENLSDSVNLSEDYSRLSNFNRVLNDNIDFSDVPGKSSNTFRFISDTLDISDNLIKSLNYLITRTDTFNLSDSLIYNKENFVVLSDVINLSEKLIQGGNVTKLLADNLVISDFLTKEVIMNVADSLNITDSLLYTLVHNFAEALSDSFTLTDKLTKENNLSLTESLIVQDLLISSIGRTIILSDSLNLSDNPNAYKGIVQVITEFILKINDKARILRTGDYQLNLKTSNDEYVLDSTEKEYILKTSEKEFKLKSR